MANKMKSIRFLVICLFCIISFFAEATTVKITCRSKGIELELCKQAIKEWEKISGHKVEIVTLPHSSNECFGLYRQWFGAGSSDVDVLQLDIAWVGVFGEYLSDLSEYVGNELLNDYFQEIKESMYYNGKIIALPWYTDVGIIFYRKDLLEKYCCKVPETWEELYDTARKIQISERGSGNSKMWGVVFQAKAFEVLTCNVLEFLDSFGGGIVDNHGNLIINSPANITAMKFFAAGMGKVTPIGALNYSEEDARGVFQSGNCVFIRIWPYAWSLMNDPNSLVVDKIGAMPIPMSINGGKRSGTLGGWHLGVSKFCKNKEIAANLVLFLTSKEQQKYRAIRASYAPVFKDLYSDKEILETNPFFLEIYRCLLSAVRRPSNEFGKYYNQASAEIFNSAHCILSGEVSAQDGIKGMSKRLGKILKTLIHGKEDRSLSSRIKCWWFQIKKWYHDAF